MSVEGQPIIQQPKIRAQVGILQDTGEPFLAFLADEKMIVGIKGGELFQLFQMLKDMLEGPSKRPRMYD